MSSEQFEQNLSIVRKMYKAFEERDAATVFGGFSPEIEMYQTDLLPWGGLYKGIEAARQFYANLLSHIDSRVEAQEIFAVSGNMVSVVGRTRGVVCRNEKRFDVRIVHLWTLKEGKVVKFAAYIDTPAMLAALKDN